MPAVPPRVVWVHPSGGFLGLSLFNGLLRILTLGVYHFWGKAEVRQRIWSAVRVDGEPLEYRGTGAELFRGFLIVFVLVLLPLGLLGFAVTLFDAHGAGRATYQLGFWLLLFVLSGYGIHRARRYRLSRTRWRGIRAGMAGPSTPFAWTYLWTLLLVPLTLGWIVPWRTVRLQSALVEQTRFGDKTFAFSGTAGPLYKRFWLVWVSAIVLVIGTVAAIAVMIGMQVRASGMPTLSPRNMTSGTIARVFAVIFLALLIFAIIRAWYGTRVMNYFASQTRFEGARFRLDARVGSFVWLTASNFLIRYLSLGFLSPIAEARSMRYIIDRLSIDAAIPWQQIAQNPDVLLKSGEGLAEAFNVDAF